MSQIPTDPSPFPSGDVPPPPGVPQAGAPVAAAVLNAYAGAPPTKEDQNMAMLCYLLAIFTGFLGPLIIWLMKKETSAFVNDQGKEVINWGITVLIAYIIGMLLVPLFLIGVLVILAVIVCHLVFTIIGALKANKGIAYRYPFALRLIK